jgi:uncharacterized LabA/DUF88 family protein
MRRVFVYVDGFNLYYRALKKAPAHKWLNLAALAQPLLQEDCEIAGIKYFTARVTGRRDPDEPRRQQIYLNALSTTPNLSIHYGRFLSKTKMRPLVSDETRYVEVHDTEEKGSDVGLAIHMLNDGWMNKYDIALLLSQDTDLLDAVSFVRRYCRKTVGVVWLDGTKVPGKWSNAASFTLQLTPSRLAAAQFPDQIMGRGGHYIKKPGQWA